MKSSKYNSEKTNIHNSLGQSMSTDISNSSKPIDISSWQDGPYIIKIGNIENKMIKQ